MDERSQILWNILVELRKEILLAQETRAKLIAVKITAVSAGIGLIYANIDKVNSNLLIVPAVASIFFDILISSYSISTKRIGFYCRHYLEPGLIASRSLPDGFMYWEDFVEQKLLKQLFSLFGNLGLTSIIISLTIINCIINLSSPYGVLTSIALMFLLFCDLYAHLYPSKKINKLKIPKLKYE